MKSPVVFLHGWAQSRQIWVNQFERFANALFLNLPGHGGAEDRPADQWLDAIVEQLPDKPCHLTGWSLGGMLAMQIAARFPERISSLTLVSTTPRFRVGKDWGFGSSEEVFSGFSQAVTSGSPKALSRFFALMLFGDQLSRSDYNRLAKAAVDRQNSVSAAGLAGGLELLELFDLRQLVEQIRQPTLVIHGESDAIVPAQAGNWLAENLTDSTHELLSACGHAPFLTQAELFNTKVQSWWLQQ